MRKELEEAIGKKYVFFCMNYIYAGTVSEVRETSVGLKDAGVVYETGAFEDKKWSEFQSLNTSLHNITYSAVESFGETKYRN